MSVDEIYVKPSTQLNFDGPLLCGVTTDLIRNAVSLSTALDKVYDSCTYIHGGLHVAHTRAHTPFCNLLIE